MVPLPDILRDKTNVYIPLANAILRNHPSRLLYTQATCHLIEDSDGSDTYHSTSYASTDEESKDKYSDDNYNDNDYDWEYDDYNQQPKLAEIPCDEYL